MTKEKLRTAIIESLTTQGFYVNGHIAPSLLNKNHFRQIQSHSRNEQINLFKEFLKRNLKNVEKYFLNGWDVNPYEIELELRVVEEGSIEEILFRWWNLMWWSVPYQKAYGRQIRALVWDKTHNAPFGLIGLQSPILRMSVRDDYLAIPKEHLDYWVNKSMQAQRLGALPPFNQILGSKMVALSLVSNELREYYNKKYAEVKTVLKERTLKSELLFLTTTSAFGKSSVYNRLKFKNEFIAESLGYTKGSGSFHISKALYDEIKIFLEHHSIDTNTTFGFGPSRKVKLLYTAFRLLGLNNYHYHNIQREFFLFPLVKNLKGLIATNSSPDYHDRPLAELANFWKERWALPRFERDNGWIDFDAELFYRKIHKELF